MLKTISLLSFSLLFPAIFLTGCASVSVGKITSKGAVPKKLPTKIFVREFTAPLESFRVDRQGKELHGFIEKERHALAEDIVLQLNKYIAPAEILPDDKIPKRGDAWLLDGSYVRVNQGSRLLRAGIGFGAGGTKMETHTELSELASKKRSVFLSLFTTGGSGMAPGAWAAFTPAATFYWPSAVANAGGASFSGLSIDRGRTAHEIVATLSQYCVDHHLISEQHARHPKMLHRIPPLQLPDFVIPAQRSQTNR